VLQRLVAGAGDPASAVRFDYAVRGTTVAQQLLIGGLVVAALPDWSARRRAGLTIGRDVATTGLIACLLLVAAASIAFVAAPVITAVAFERGAFLSADTDAVATLVRWLLVGFVAEGVGLVLVQAIVAAGRNDLALVIGFGRLAIQATTTVVLGVSFGAAGVSAAYSVAFAIASAGIVLLARRQGLFEPPRFIAMRVVAGSILVAASAAVLYALRGIIPPAYGAVLVGVIAGVGIVALGLTPTLRAWVRRPSGVEDPEMATG
jgi:putative peptidoglycan lipid II flippase